MTRQITPSTGRTREVGNLRMNVRGFQSGERVLVRFSGLTYAAAEIISLGDVLVLIECPPGSGSHINVRYGELIGVIPDGTDDRQLLADLAAREVETAAVLEAARARRKARMRKLLRSYKLGRMDVI